MYVFSGHCRAEAVLPCCHVAEGLLKFPDTFIGASFQLPLTLVNTTPVPATLICDLIQQPEFDMMVSRDAWAGAGYTACPVQKIGANGEVSTVGSKRASKRTSRRYRSRVLYIELVLLAEVQQLEVNFMAFPAMLIIDIHRSFTML